MTIPTKDQVAGCLIGQCLGDALGFLVEGYPSESCGRYIAQIIESGKAPTLTRGGFRFGQYSDDSQLARELILTYLECRDVDPGNYAARIAKIFAEERVIGWGLATREAAERLNAGVSWDKAGAEFPSAGNGSAMRAGPVGIFFHDQPENMIRAAIDQSRVTHRDPRCLAGSIAIAGAVALALPSGPINISQYLNQLSAWAAGIDSTMAECLLQLVEWVKLPPEEAASYISFAGYQPGYDPDWEGISPYVISSVLWSIYAFLRSPDDFMESMRITIAVGGDVDTTGAMTGAVSGAHLGLAALPKHLAKFLNDQDTWNYDDLQELAEKCHAAIHSR